MVVLMATGHNPQSVAHRQGKKESIAERNRRWFREAEEECSKPRVGSCANCTGPTLNLPFSQNGMLRQVVLCPRCSYGNNPDKAAEVVAAISRIRRAA